jgi:hypothetical protein
VIHIDNSNYLETGGRQEDLHFKASPDKGDPISETRYKQKGWEYGSTGTAFS